MNRLLKCSTFAVVLLLPAIGFAQPYLYGVDVSHWQGGISWSSVANDGIDFAFCKATEGVDWLDSRFEQNMNGASAAGVLIGPYHYARPDSYENDPLDAAKEAADFVYAIEPYYQAPGNFLRPVIDVEELPDSGDIPPGMSQKAFLSEWIRDFQDVVEAELGFTAIIYCNSNYARYYLEPDIAQYDLWLANWNYTPPYSEPPSSQLGIWDEWAFWQYSATGSVSGISGGVDLDVFEGTMDDLEGYLGVPTYDPDLDGDGDVDVADLLAWQSGDATADGLAAWQNGFGTLAATTAVPEPAGWMLAALGLFLTGQRKRF